MTDSDLDRDVSHIWSLLFEMVLDAERRLAGLLMAHHLTPPQFYVLKTLTEHGGRYAIGQIARAHGLTNATMTGLVKRLESMKLVQREKNVDDRRSVYVTLTPEGVERFSAVQVDLLAQLQTILGLLSPQERQDLLRYLTRYIDRVVGER
jgi:DNA-binding MarR family transcriptional regulator